MAVGVAFDYSKELRFTCLRFEGADVRLNPVEVDLGPDPIALGECPLPRRRTSAQGTRAQSFGNR